MAILNITYQGLSIDYARPIDASVSDYELRRIAAELVRSGELKGLHIANLSDRAFDDYVVDRLKSPRGEDRIYLRPKVPFGGNDIVAS